MTQLGRLIVWLAASSVNEAEANGGAHASAAADYSLPPTETKQIPKE